MDLKNIILHMKKMNIVELMKIKPFKRRFLYNELKTNLETIKNLTKKPVILLYGLRGTGKTTLLFQLLSELRNSIYISADHIYFREYSLYDICVELRDQGYKYVFIDEIHKKPDWVENLKNIYDFLDLQVIASGSSNASIYKGSLKLGRRALAYKLNPLSFKEYIYLKTGKKITTNFTLLLKEENIFEFLEENPELKEYYIEYLQYGGFPFYLGQKDHKQLLNLLQKMIYEDALSEFNLSLKKIDVIEKILSFLAKSKLGEFSITSFAKKSGISKSRIYDALELLVNMQILVKIYENKSTAELGEQMKILFIHPNIRFAFAKELYLEENIGALREEYFVFHCIYNNISINLPKKLKKNPDYVINVNNKSYIVEIGGKSKTKEQIKEYKVNFIPLIFDDDHLRLFGCL